MEDHNELAHYNIKAWSGDYTATHAEDRSQWRVLVHWREDGSRQNKNIEGRDGTAVLIMKFSCRLRVSGVVIDRAAQVAPWQK